VLNKKSGVFGLSGGVSSDFRDLNAAANEGNDKARLALDTYYYRVAKYIAGYAVALQGIDVISFTAGVGENDFGVRENVCKLLAFVQIRNRIAGLPFGHRLPRDAEFFRYILLRQLAQSAQGSKIILEHLYAPS
jgi:hypothetical protein